MPLQLIRADITRLGVDAVVAPAGSSGVPAGGAAHAILTCAGPELARAAAGKCVRAGDAFITPGFDLCRYVIHTRGPVWRGGGHGEDEALMKCYTNSLLLAADNGAESVAFPLISAGAHGYPAARAVNIAVRAISGFLMETNSDINVLLTLFSKDEYRAGSAIYAEIASYIDDNYIDESREATLRQRRAYAAMEERDLSDEAEHDIEKDVCAAAVSGTGDGLWDIESVTDLSLDDMLGMPDESFSQMVMRRISEKGIKPSECYKKANIDKKLFSKIKGDIHYNPKKTTALAIAVALEMDTDETRELLRKAGLALSRSSKFDIIVEYFIAKGRYDIFEINEALFLHDQPLLGSFY